MQVVEPITPDFTLEVVRDPTGCNTASGLRNRRPAPRGLGLPPSAAGGQSSLCDVVAIRCHAVHRQDRHALGRRSGHRPSGEHEHDGRRARAHTADAGAIGRAHASGSHKATFPGGAGPYPGFRAAAVCRAVILQPGGPLDEANGPSGLGPRAMAAGADGVLGNNTTRYVFPMEGKWHFLPKGK